jgi:hypothetical protein
MLFSRIRSIPRRNGRELKVQNRGNIIQTNTSLLQVELVAFLSQFHIRKLGIILLAALRSPLFANSRLWFATQIQNQLE